MKRALLFTAISFAAVAAAPASAADLGGPAPVYSKAAPVPYYVNYIVASNNQIVLQVTGNRLDYAEQAARDIALVYSPGNYLRKGGFFDGEKGWTPGVGLKLSVMNDWLVENGYFSGEGTYSSGHVNYTGYLQNAHGELTSPSSSKNHAEFDDFSLRFGQGFAISRYWMITPFAEYGYHRWDRKVNEGETYRNQYGGAGVLLQVSPVERLVWSLSGMVGSTFGAQIDIEDARQHGIALGSGLTWKVATGIDYALTQNWHVSAEASYMAFKYGISAVVPNLASPGHGVYEPDSRTNVTMVKLGIGYSWGAPSSRY